MMIVLLFWFNLPVNLAWCLPMDLKQAVEYAVKHSPSIKSAQADLNVAELQVKSQFAKMLPSFDFTATHGLQNDIPVNPGSGLYSLNPAVPWSSVLNLGISENLYDNGTTLTQLGIARLGREIAEIKLKKARESLSLDVAREFYDLSLAMNLLEVRKQQEATIQKQFKKLSDQYQQGLKTKTDTLRIQTQAQRAELLRINAENAIAVSGLNLRRLLAEGIQDELSVEFIPVSVDKNKKRDHLLPSESPVLEEFFDSKTYHLRNEINGKSVYLAQRNYWPQVFVNAGTTYSNSAYLNSGLPFNQGSRMTWNALLTLQYNIWDWGVRRRDIEVAELTRNIQENGLILNLLQVKMSMGSLMLDIRRIQKSLSLNQELLTAEEQTYQTLESQYREGKVAYLDLITELNNLLDAQIQFYSIYFEALSSKAKHSYYKGTLYDAISGTPVSESKMD